MATQDLTVVLPGTTGSVLQKDGKDILVLFAQAISSFLRSFGGSLQGLRIVKEHDPEMDGFQDCVVVSELLPHARISSCFSLRLSCENLIVQKIKRLPQNTRRGKPRKISSVRRIGSEFRSSRC